MGTIARVLRISVAAILAFSTSAFAFDETQCESVEFGWTVPHSAVVDRAFDYLTEVPLAGGAYSCVIVRADDGFAFEVHETIPNTDNDYGLIHNENATTFRLISARGNGRDIAQCEGLDNGTLQCWFDFLGEDGLARMIYTRVEPVGFLPVGIVITGEWVRRHSVSANREGSSRTYEIGVREPVPSVWGLTPQEDGTLTLSSTEDTAAFISRVGDGSDGAALAAFTESRHMDTAFTRELPTGQLFQEMRRAEAFFQLVAGGYN